MLPLFPPYAGEAFRAEALIGGKYIDTGKGACKRANVCKRAACPAREIHHLQQVAHLPLLHACNRRTHLQEVHVCKSFMPVTKLQLCKIYLCTLYSILCIVITIRMEEVYLPPRAPPYRYIYRPASSRCALARVYLLPAGISLTGESLLQAPSYGRMFLTVPGVSHGLGRGEGGAFDRRPFLRASIFWTVLLFDSFFSRQHHLQTFEVPSKNLVAVLRQKSRGR
jgi:hypothetical protein